MKEARMAELEFKVQIQQFYIEKNLNVNCRVNTDTGEITWPEEIPETTPEVPEAKKQACAQVTEESVIVKKPRRAKKGEAQEIIDAEFIEEKAE